MGFPLFWGPGAHLGTEILHPAAAPIPYPCNTFTEGPHPLDLGAFLGSRRTRTPRVSGVPPAHRLGAGWERGLCGTDGRTGGSRPRAWANPESQGTGNGNRLGRGILGRKQKPNAAPTSATGRAALAGACGAEPPSGKALGSPRFPAEPGRGKRGRDGGHGARGRPPRAPLGRYREDNRYPSGEWKLEEKGPGARRSGARGG